ncbi:MAG TPA: GntR family transcriptional regulator [Conexibacter sp.]|nr:GntR family transcriptional regulator [Conexibacter sp.]
MTSADSDALEIALDRDADVPLGVQLAWALRARIVAGTLAAGDRLPALHRLAAETGVNANTVRAVYQRLEQDGLVATRHGSGTFVTGAGAAGDRHALAQLAADAARAAHAAGVDPREVAAALYGSGDVPAPPDGEAAARRRLRAQIAALEHALSELTARHPPRAAAELGPPATPRPRLLSAAELAQQRDELLRRLAEAHADMADPPAQDPPPARRRAPARQPKLRPAPRAT